MGSQTQWATQFATQSLTAAHMMLWFAFAQFLLLWAAYELARQCFRSERARWAGVGLLAAGWERWSGRAAPIAGSHRLGVVLFLLITGGWFGWAYLELGQALIDRMIFRELLRHAIDRENKKTISADFIAERDQRIEIRRQRIQGTGVSDRYQ